MRVSLKDWLFRAHVLLAMTFLCIFSTTLAEDRKVLIVSIDGLRPDVLLRSEAPFIRSLMKRGSFTFHAQTTDVAITLPSHTTMLTGVPPSVHGVTWNDDRYTKVPHYPSMPTIFTYAKQAGHSTALIAGKSKFVSLAQPGSLDWQFIPTTTHVSDEIVAQKAEQIIKDHQPDLSFVHFPHVDIVGHDVGWGSDEQVQAIHVSDALVGSVVNTFERMVGSREYLIMVSSDHGGSGTSHDGADPRSLAVPLLIVGTKVPAHFDLTLNRSRIGIEDIFMTASQFLGLHPGAVAGRALSFAPTEKASK
jgi:predicted AlkP superfamily pyrophosphatase or phosphodiesterase